MASLRPSQYAMQQRTDGGPFLRFDLEDAVTLSEEEIAEMESDGDDVGIYGTSRVYYSDVPLAEDAPNWHLIVEVMPEYLTLYPIIPRSVHPDYGQSKYDPIKSIIITRQVYTPYAHPTDEADLDELLSGLPDGLIKDWRYGLGFHYEYRYIVQAISLLDGVDTLILHGATGQDDAKIKGNEYYLGTDCVGADGKLTHPAD